MGYLSKFKIKGRFKNSPPVRIALWARNCIRALKYHLKFYRNLVRGDRVSDIKVISIEFSSVCNLRCRYCHLEKALRPDFLPFDTYKKLLDEICRNPDYDIKIMEWPISGCFFLHPRYQDIIKITREYELKYPDFSPWVILNDNMMLFGREKADFVLGEGVIDQIICSIDGVDKSTFEHMRPNADFEKVLDNTLYLLSARGKFSKRPVIHINNGIDDSCVSGPIDPRLKEIFHEADHVTRWEPVDWNESFHGDPPRYIPAKRFCSFVFESATVSTSGKILKCCMDLKESTGYGDLRKDTLESIWFSDGRRAFLKLMHGGKRSLLPGCGNCSITYVGRNKKE